MARAVDLRGWSGARRRRSATTRAASSWRWDLRCRHARCGCGSAWSGLQAAERVPRCCCCRPRPPPIRTPCCWARCRSERLRCGRHGDRPAPPVDILAQLAAHAPVASSGDPGLDPEAGAPERRQRMHALLLAMLDEADAAFRPVPVLYQDFWSAAASTGWPATRSTCRGSARRWRPHGPGSIPTRSTARPGCGPRRSGGRPRRRTRHVPAGGTGRDERAALPGRRGDRPRLRHPPAVARASATALARGAGGDRAAARRGRGRVVAPSSRPETGGPPDAQPAMVACAERG